MVLRGAHPGWLIVGYAAVGNYEPPRAENAWALDQAGVDRFPQRHVDEPGAAGDGNAGDPGPQHLLSVDGRPYGGELRAGGSPGDAQAGHGWLAKGEVAVTLDKAGHYPSALSVDGLHVLPIFNIDVRRYRSHTADTVALDHHRVVGNRRLARSVNEGTVADYRGLRVAGAHSLLLW